MRVWEERPFHEGDDLSEEEWRSILRRTDTVRARGIALSLLSRTEHSRFLISQKLRQRELEPEVYEPVLDALEEGGQLSDARFAASWIRSRLHSHPEGRMHLMGGLRSRGVSEAVAQAALEQVLAEEELTMVDVARSLLERLLRRKKLPNDALATRMMRRGFSRQTINRVLSSDYSPYD